MPYTVAATNNLDRPILQALTAISSTAVHPVGYATKASTGEEYVYSQTSTSITAAPIATYPAYFCRGTTDLVTSTLADAGGGDFAGVFCAAIANATPGTNYVWRQTKGRVPSAHCSAAAGNVLSVAATGMLTAFPSGAVSDSVAGVTYALTGYNKLAVALQVHTGNLADIMLVEK